MATHSTAQVVTHNRVGPTQYLALGLLAQAEDGTLALQVWSRFITQLGGYTSTRQFANNLRAQGLVTIDDKARRIFITDLGYEQRLSRRRINQATFYRIPDSMARKPLVK